MCEKKKVQFLKQPLAPGRTCPFCPPVWPDLVSSSLVGWGSPWGPGRERWGLDRARVLCVQSAKRDGGGGRGRGLLAQFRLWFQMH